MSVENTLTDLIGNLSLDDVPAEQKQAIEKLKELDGKYVEHDVWLQEEILKLEAEFRKRTAPVISERKEVLTTNKIPNFWLRALVNNRALGEMVEPHDQPILEHLEDITVEYPNELEPSFNIRFKFSANEFFEQTELLKEYKLYKVNDSAVEHFDSVTSTTITWKEGKDITKKVVTSVQRNKRTSQTRTINKTVDVPSFFQFFRTFSAANEVDLESMSTDEVEQLHVLMQADFEAARKLREYVIPRAITWYMGEGEDSDDEDYDDEYDFDEDGDDEDDEDAEEGEESAGGAKKEECKQQ